MTGTLLSGRRGRALELRDGGDVAGVGRRRPGGGDATGAECGAQSRAPSQAGMGGATRAGRAGRRIRANDGNGDRLPVQTQAGAHRSLLTLSYSLREPRATMRAGSPGRVEGP